MEIDTTKSGENIFKTFIPASNLSVWEVSEVSDHNQFIKTDSLLMPTRTANTNNCKTTHNSRTRWK